jgi:tight adherence protein C
MNIVLYSAFTITLALLVVLLVAPVLMKPSAAAKRLQDAVQSTRPDRRTIRSKEQIRETILTVTRFLHSHFAFAGSAKAKKQLLLAGFKDSRSVDVYIAASVIAPLLGGVLGSFAHQYRLFWSLSLGVVFYLFPDTWLGIRVRKRKEMIRRGIPDALDLLVVCVDAGLGLDQAMLRVGQELAISHRSLNQEFKQINLEQLAGKPRLEAWKSAAERTEIPEFGLFVTMLTQSDKFGTPVISALSRLAEEIRTKRRQRAGEKAAKTKITILFPVVIFIFPCIFIVLLAPAILNMARSLQALK